MTSSLAKSQSQELDALLPDVRELTVNEIVPITSTSSHTANNNNHNHNSKLEFNTDSEDCISAVDDEDADSAEEVDTSSQLVEALKAQAHPPLASDYIKVESKRGDRKWNILVFPNMTVRDIIEKLAKRVDDKYKFFELHQVYEDKQVIMLNPDIKVSWVIAAQSTNPQKYKLVFNFEETKYAQIESMNDGHKWNLKLGPLATVEEVCSKLALRNDAKYNAFELYEIKDKAAKIQLDPKDKIFDIISKWGPHHGRHKLSFFCYTKDLGPHEKPLQIMSADSTRRPPTLPTFVPPTPVPKDSFLKKKRNKFNSTSTLYATTTISKPDVDELLHCMSKALLFHIEKGCRLSDKKYYDIFNEKLRPLTREIIDFNKLPSVHTIYEFVKQIYEIGRLDPECVIMALAYIEKLIEKTQITIDTTNWRRITFIALTVALKTWEDLAVYNLEFIGVFNGKLSTKDLNNLEMQFLCLLEYSVYLPASLYAKYYFELRKFSKVDEAHFPLKPLDKEKAKLLELRTQSSQKISKEMNHSISVDQIKATEVKAPAIIS